MTLQLAIMLGALVFNLVCTVVGVTWFVSNRLRDHEQHFTEAMNAHQISDNMQFSAVRSEIVASGDLIRREFGETSAAQRQKMHDMETWNRDTFLRRDSFFEVTKVMASDIKSLIEKVTRIDGRQEAERG